MSYQSDPNERGDIPAQPMLESDHDGQKPWLALHHEIIQLWQEMLGVKEIEIHDSFYQLGGDSHLAVDMLLRLEATFDKIIPISSLSNLTVEHLADELRSGEEAKPPLTLKYNEHGTKPPLLYLHGDVLGGGFYCRKLANHLSEAQPLYAIPPTEVQCAADCPSIGEMAAAHIRTLPEIHRDGPYALGGFCDGGLVAYEMARQLDAAGRGPKALLLIDTIAPEQALQRARKVIQIIGSLSGMSQDDRIRLLPRTWDRLERFLRWLRAGRPERAAIAKDYLRSLPKKVMGRKPAVSGERNPPVKKVDQTPAPQREIPHAYLWATAGHKVGPYSGGLDLIMADESERARRDAIWGWKDFAGDIRVHRVPGGHLEAITTHVGVLAEKISLCLSGMNRSREGLVDNRIE